MRDKRCGSRRDRVEYPAYEAVLKETRCVQKHGSYIPVVPKRSKRPWVICSYRYQVYVHQVVNRAQASTQGPLLEATKTAFTRTVLNSLARIAYR
jgi:hypothetical protein